MSRAAAVNQELQILNDIPVKLDLQGIITRLRFHGYREELLPALRELTDRLILSIRPGAIYKRSQMTGVSLNSLEIDGIRFNRPLLYVNLRQAEAIFPFLVTCGSEMDNFQISPDNRRMHYSLKVIKDMVMDAALEYLGDYIALREGFKYVWSLSPGEMQAWPQQDRSLLLSLFSGAEDLIGVQLAKDYSFLPAYSRAGLFYSFKVELEICQVCDKQICMMRRAPFNPGLVQKLDLKLVTSCSGKVQYK